MLALICSACSLQVEHLCLDVIVFDIVLKDGVVIHHVNFSTFSLVFRVHEVRFLDSCRACLLSGVLPQAIIKTTDPFHCRNLDNNFE